MNRNEKLAPGIFGSLKYDVPAGVVVFLVALPLCLGIALASNASLISGLISGIIAGLVVGLLSGSSLSVSGPAAGLAVVVVNGIATAGSFASFLNAVIVAGVIQIIFGVLRAGFIGSFMPISVIKGMLAAIGIIIVLKQIPHGLGRDSQHETDLSFLQTSDSSGPFYEILQAGLGINFPVLLITTLCLAVLIFWETPTIKKQRWSQWMPGPLAAVVTGIVMNALYQVFYPEGALTGDSGHLVQLPILSSLEVIRAQVIFPNFEFTKDTFILGATIAVIASIETLLSIEASDKLDPYKRISNKNRELLAQGTGNVLAGFAGGIPITSVIVRSSANIYAGGRTRVSGILHGALLLISVLVIPHLLNHIPLASLAAILLVVGYKLANVSLFKKMYNAGPEQFVPFIVTVTSVVAFDLLTGVLIGLATGFLVIVKSSYYSAVTMVNEGESYYIKFRKDVTFLNKSKLKGMLSEIPQGASVVIDGTNAMFIDADIYEVIEDFKETGDHSDIKVETRNLRGKQFSLSARRRRHS